MNYILIGNIISFIGAAMMVGIGFVKERKNILLLQSAQYGILAVGNLVLGGVTGAIANVLSIVRNIVCLRRRFTAWMSVLFVALQIGLTFLMNPLGLIGWLPVIAAIIYTFSINSKDEIMLKFAIILAQICWTFFDIRIQNYASMVFDIFTILANLWGIKSIVSKRKHAAE